MNGNQIFTFYSYKGGSGRTMALANTAWILASNGKRVLAIDWDLEAPGLHRYFAPFLPDPELGETAGVIDFFYRYVVAATTPAEDENVPETWYERYASLTEYAQPLSWKFEDGGAIDFLPAGRQDASYSIRANTFDWNAFYARFGGGAFLDAVVAAMRREYDYVLIDSRTGVSDTAGICTVHLPDTLVVFFTANNQSIRGAWSVANTAYEQRRSRPLRILPVFTRVEQSEQGRLELSRAYMRVQFAPLLSRQSIAAADYWRRVETPYFPLYAYEEILATFQDQPGEKGTVLEACEALTALLTEERVTALRPPTETERTVVKAKFQRASPTISARQRLPNNSILFCYNRDDRRWAEQLGNILRPLLRKESIDVWSDENLVAGADWKSEIERKISRARVAVVLVSNHLLASDFYLNVEQPALLRRAEQEGLTVIWVPLTASLYEHTEISRFAYAYDPARPLDSLTSSQRTRALVEISRRIIDAADPLAASALQAVSETRQSQETVTEVNLTNLPRGGELLIGRERELTSLDDAWVSHRVNVATIVARGGEGKSTLVRHWLNAMAADGWRGAERVFGWSFYSQGFDRESSADQFIEQALRFFGDTNSESVKSPHERGERLASLIGGSRNLLVLDGLEPLQYPPGPMQGRLRNPALQTLLAGLSARNHGLCVITTREALPELAAGQGNVSPTVALPPLNDSAGAQLLERLGVGGSTAEREAVSQRMDGHPLSLNLMGAYLAEVYDGDVTRAGDVILLDQDRESGSHAYQLLASYEKWLASDPDSGTRMLAILRLTGLFDRPARLELFDVLRDAPPIEGLTEPIVEISPSSWNRAKARLRSMNLVSEDKDTIDAHPLVREYFAEQLARRSPSSAHEAHRRVFEYLSTTTADLPATLADMAPLYQAVWHGCRAGLHAEVLERVYRRRIQRDTQMFASRTLGAISANLGALVSFFDEPWKRPVSTLEPPHDAYVLAEAGFHLRALGRSSETADALASSLRLYISIGDHISASAIASNIADLRVLIGDVAGAIAVGELAIELADRSRSIVRQIASRACLADALHAAGFVEEALAGFAEAESLQGELEPQRPLLLSIHGYRYCDLLLRERFDFQSLQERAKAMLSSASQNRWLLDNALDQLVMARIISAQASRPWFDNGMAYADASVSLFREAGTQDWLPAGLIGRAAIGRRGIELGVEVDVERAEHDLEEADQIATRTGMRRWQIDALTERVRLYIAVEQRLSHARFYLEQAARLTFETKRVFARYQSEQSDWRPPSWVNSVKGGQMLGYERGTVAIKALTRLLDNRGH